MIINFFSLDGVEASGLISDPYIAEPCRATNKDSLTWFVFNPLDTPPISFLRLSTRFYLTHCNSS